MSTRSTAVRVRDLPQRAAYGVGLYCWRCGSSYSATAGDYFMADPNTVMRCRNGHRPINLRLVRECTTHEPITAAAAESAD